MFEWLGEGGVREDEGGVLSVVLGTTRFFRHFHDPLYQADGSGRGPWAQAGLRYRGQHESSIRWMQRPDQDAQAPGTGNWSWQDARRHYLNALTRATREDRGNEEGRDKAFADTFRALGQVMHLVVDASVPEHVRNDAHPLGFIFGNYEYWVSNQHAESRAESTFIATYLSNPISFDPVILQQPTGDTLASVPIARLIDTDTYKGLENGPNVTLGFAIGIAEFANANFFSEDTGALPEGTETPPYPFPNSKALVPSEHPAPKTGRVRAYYRKGEGDGLPVDPVLAECVLDEPAQVEGIFEPRLYACVDENVWAQTAQAMLPRAVGYARGVLDYFFRGQFEVTLSANPANPAQQELKATNRSMEPLGPGTLTLYAEDVNGLRQPVLGAALTLTEPVAPDTALPVLTFTPPAEAKRVVLVFEGTLGEEAGAVVGKVVETRVGLEQLYYEWASVGGQSVQRWILRTSDGLYLLPFQDFLPSDYDVGWAKWGERDNTLLVESYLAPDFVEAAFSVFELNRPAGSRQVPTTGAFRDGLPIVDLRLVMTVPLLPLGFECKKLPV